jgi:hypothetical protein
MSDNHEEQDVKDESNEVEAHAQYGDSDEDGDSPPSKGKGDRPPQKRAGRRKINIEFIKDKSRRHITFSKRKAGIMKKAYELSTLTGTQVLLLVASETGHVYTFATPKLQPLITKTEGKNLIQACLNAPDPQPNLDQQDAGGADMGGNLPTGMPSSHYGLDMDDQKQKMRGDMKNIASGYPNINSNLPSQLPPSPSPQGYGGPPQHHQQLPSLQNPSAMSHQYGSGLDIGSGYMTQQQPQQDFSPQGNFGQGMGMGMGNRSSGMPPHMGGQYGGSGGYGGMNPNAGVGMGGMDTNPHKVTIYNPNMRGPGPSHTGLDQYYTDK